MRKSTQATAEPRGPRITPSPLPLPGWGLIWAVNVFLLACTIPAAAHVPHHMFLRPFHLGIETNIATWWSGMLALFFALLAHSNSLALRSRDRGASLAWLVLAIVGLGLFADEVGSIHEEADYLIPLLHGRFLVVPLAALASAILVTSVVILYRRGDRYGRVSILILSAIVLLLAAYAQELIEQNRNFSWLERGFRTGVEEGTELSGMFLLLLAASRARRVLAPAGETDLLPGPPTIAWVTRLGAVSALPIVLFRHQLSAADLRLPGTGDFGMILPILLFVAAALLAWRRARERPPDRRGWLVLALVLALHSIAAEVHFHRVLLGYVSSRYDLDLVPGFLLLAFAAARVEPLRRGRVFAGLALLALLTLFSIFVFPEAGLAIAIFHVESLAAAAAVLWAMRSPRPMPAENERARRASMISPGAVLG